MSESQSEILQQLAVPRYAPRPKPTTIPTAAWNDAPLFCLQVNGEWVSHILGVLEALDQYDTWIGTDAEIDAARANVNEIMLALMNACPPTRYQFWADTDTPDTLDSGDGDSVALGMKFHTSVYGNILGLRFYKSEANIGTHTGYLWTDDAEMLGSVEFADESASGWQVAYFAEPIAIEACKTYLMTYHAPNGHYSYSRPFFTTEIARPPIYAPEGTFESGNGVYGYGAAGTFPDNTYEQSNYFIDVIFEPTGADYLE